MIYDDQIYQTVIFILSFYYCDDTFGYRTTSRLGLFFHIEHVQMQKLINHAYSENVATAGETSVYQFLINTRRNDCKR